MTLLEWARSRRAVRPGLDRRGLRRPRGAAAARARTDPLRPSSPYSAAKAGGDLQVLAYVRTYGVNASITRGANTYGPNQYPEKLVPLFVTNALDGAAAARLRRRQAGARVAPCRGSLRGHRARPARRAPRRDLQRRRRGPREPRGDAPDPRADGRRSGPRPPRRGPRGARPPLRDRRREAARARLGAAATRSARPGCARPSTGTARNRDWWEPIKSGDYRRYYEEQYAERLRA